MGSGMAEAYKPDTRSRLKPIEASRMALGSSRQLAPVATAGIDNNPKDTLICRGSRCGFKPRSRAAAFSF